MAISGSCRSGAHWTSAYLRGGMAESKAGRRSRAICHERQLSIVDSKLAAGVRMVGLSDQVEHELFESRLVLCQPGQKLLRRLVFFAQDS